MGTDSEEVEWPLLTTMIPRDICCKVLETRRGGGDDAGDVEGKYDG